VFEMTGQQKTRVGKKSGGTMGYTEETKPQTMEKWEVGQKKHISRKRQVESIQGMEEENWNPSVKRRQNWTSGTSERKKGGRGIK